MFVQILNQLLVVFELAVIAFLTPNNPKDSKDIEFVYFLLKPTLISDEYYKFNQLSILKIQIGLPNKIMIFLDLLQNYNCNLLLKGWTL